MEHAWDVFFSAIASGSGHMYSVAVQPLYTKNLKNSMQQRSARNKGNKQISRRVTSFQTGLPQKGEQKGQTWIAAEGKKIFPLLSADLS